MGHSRFSAPVANCTGGFETHTQAAQLEFRCQAVKTLREMQGDLAPVKWVRDLTLQVQPLLVARLYMPLEPLVPLPLLVFFHGGGWSRGDLDLYDGPARALATATGCLTVTVNYRLAPQHRFPTPLLDCYRATLALEIQAEAFGFDPTRIVVAGDSAGGNLAAAVCLIAKNLGAPRIAHQLLVYPPLDALMTSPSYETYRETAFLSAAAMRRDYGVYAREATVPTNPWLSPLYAESLAGLPSATIITAEVDPVRDDGERYGQRLAEVGVEVYMHRCPGIPHMAIHMLGVDAACRQIYEHASAGVRRRFEKPP